MFSDINGFFICSIQNKFVPLHREPAPGMSVHRQRRVADILKRRLLRSVLTLRNFATFRVSSGLSNDRCPTGYRVSFLCLFGTSFAYMYVRARVPVTITSTREIYIRRGLRVASSKIQGNAKASKCGTGKCKFHAFFCVVYAYIKSYEA